MDEMWLPVGGYEGLYEVSDSGGVRSWHTGFPKILRPAKARSGHLRVSLYDDSSKRSHLVHRLVLESFVGPCPSGQECCHGAGGPADNRLSNIRWDTRSANAKDQVRGGTHAWARKTHCPRQHEYTESNTSVNPSGSRRCRTCGREKALAAYHQRKAAV